MKKTVLLFVLYFTISQSTFSQQPYSVFSEQPNEKTYKGIISREVLMSDTSFKWYAENQANYSPNGLAMEELKKNKDSLELLVFMGTWCEDSHFVIPKLFALLDASGFPQDRVTLIGVDRNKKTYSHLCEALNVINVPTIIAMKNGKELGRVVEYGTYGLFDKELGEIIQKATAAR
ncbi:MAG: thioredoxin family protein [Bacteroidetes bacterium]|nr:thioredoxin family protein [Bacteroidota bacterium]MBS1632368.1 thioredoxin family protein [Bacteroidota bacterium]